MLGTGQQAVRREEAGIRTGQVTALLPDCQAQVLRILLSVCPQSPPALAHTVGWSHTSFFPLCLQFFLPGMPFQLPQA